MPRHGIDERTFCSKSDRHLVAEAARTTEGTYTDVVGSVGSEACEDKRGVVDNGVDAVNSHLPLRLSA